MFLCPNFYFYYILQYNWDVCFCLLVGHTDKFWRIWSGDWLWYIDHWWWRWSWRPQDSTPSVSAHHLILDFAYQVFIKFYPFFSFFFLFFFLVGPFHYYQQKKHSNLVIIINLHIVFISSSSVRLKILDPNRIF